MDYPYPLVPGRLISQTRNLRNLGGISPIGTRWVILEILTKHSSYPVSAHAICGSLLNLKAQASFIINEDFKVLNEMLDKSVFIKYIKKDIETYLETSLSYHN